MKINSKIHSLGKMICFLFICSISLFQTKTFAQISAVNSKTKAETFYTNPSIPNDSIYIFCDATGVGAGELTAISSDLTAGWSFEWMKWNTTTNDFSIPVGTGSTVSNLDDGRYQVRLSKSGEADQTYIAWVLNRRTSSVKPEIELTSMECEGVKLRGRFSGLLEYSDIGHTGSKKLYDGLKFRFVGTKGEFESDTSFAKYETEYVYETDHKIFEGESSYSIEIKDDCDKIYSSNSVSSPTIRISAAFSGEKEKDPDSSLSDKVDVFDSNSGLPNQAPLDVHFEVDTIINIDTYEWYIYRGEDLPGDLLTDEDLLENGRISGVSFFDFIFQNTGKYTVKLIVENADGCRKELAKTLEIIESLVDVPNFFMPGSGGSHDTWRIKAQSLKSFSCVILNRWGRVVHEFRNPDEGWDGKYHGKYVSPGTYFYVIKAVGREEEYPRHVKKGSITVLRKK